MDALLSPARVPNLQGSKRIRARARGLESARCPDMIERRGERDAGCRDPSRDGEPSALDIAAVPDAVRRSCSRLHPARTVNPEVNSAPPASVTSEIEGITVFFDHVYTLP